MNYNSVGERLVQRGFITGDQLNGLLPEANEGKNFVDLIVEKGLVSEKDVGEIIAEYLNIPFIELEQYELDYDVVRLIPVEIARKFRCIPFALEKNRLVCATDDPMNFFMLDEISRITDKKVTFVYSTKTDVIYTINRYYYDEYAALIDEMKLTLNAEVDSRFIGRLAEKFGLEICDLNAINFSDAYFWEVSQYFGNGLFKKYCCLPLEEKDGVKWFAIPNPADLEAYEELKAYCGKPVAFKLASRGDILRKFRSG